MIEKITWSTETRKIWELNPSPTNPRQISREQMNQLKFSIEKFGYCEIVAINRDNTILAGHMRIKALKELGHFETEIEVRVPSRMLTLEEQREYLIRSNKNTGDWDWDELANSFDPDTLSSWGFTDKELDFFEEENNEEEKQEKEKCEYCHQTIKAKTKTNRDNKR